MYCRKSLEQIICLGGVTLQAADSECGAVSCDQRREESPDLWVETRPTDNNMSFINDIMDKGKEYMEDQVEKGLNFIGQDGEISLKNICFYFNSSSGIQKFTIEKSIILYIFIVFY